MDAGLSIGGNRCTGFSTLVTFTSSSMDFLDEVGVWSRSLTDAEITALVNGTAGTTYPFR